jgi:ribonuclease-3 family protein
LDFSQIGACALAYLGDAVIEALVREHLVLKGYEKSGKLNDEARKFITAIAQSAAYHKIEGVLTEKEADIFKRARNSSHLNIPKSASATEYKNATGLEAIFGYLKLEKQSDRINELFYLAYADLI